MSDLLDKPARKRLMLIAENSVAYGGDVSSAMTLIYALEIEVETMRLVLSSVSEKADIPINDMEELLKETSLKVAETFRAKLG